MRLAWRSGVHYHIDGMVLTGAKGEYGARPVGPMLARTGTAGCLGSARSFYFGQCGVQCEQPASSDSNCFRLLFTPSAIILVPYNLFCHCLTLETICWNQARVSVQMVCCIAPNHDRESSHTAAR